MEKANSFFELSHDARQKILELALDGPRRHSEFTKALGIAPAEVTRHLQRLTSSMCIIKGSDSRYTITPLGKLLFQQSETMRFIDSNAEFFGSHDLSAFPEELLSFPILASAEIIHSPLKVFERVYRLTSFADDFILCMLPEMIDPLIVEHAHKLSRGLDLQLIVQEGRRLPAEYLDKRMMSLGIKSLSDTPVCLAASEKEAVIILQAVDENHAFNYALVGMSDAFLRWSRLLFEYYWIIGKELI